jgi:hypothetical protein
LLRPLALLQLGVDLCHQVLEFGGGGGRLGASPALTGQGERQNDKGNQNFGFHVGSGLRMIVYNLQT